VLDNLAVHKQPEVRPRLKRPAPSPILAPVQSRLQSDRTGVAKLKAFLRAARPRTFDRVATLVADALQLFTVAECGNYVRTADTDSLYRYEKRSNAR